MLGVLLGGSTAVAGAAQPTGMPAPRPSAAVTSQPEAAPERVMIVPLRGEFGVDFDARAVRDCLEFAARRRFTNVVFELDSSGGSMIDAEEIAAVLAEFDRELSYIFVIKNALGVSIRLLTSADELFVRPGALLGASGAEGLFNEASILRLEGEARPRGVLSPVIVRGMLERSASIWGRPNEPGTPWQFTDQPPVDATDFVEIDAPDTLPLFPRERLVELGVAQPSEQLAPRLAAMRDDNGRGTRLMELARERLEQSREDFETIHAWAAHLPEVRDTARGTRHPDEYSRYDYEREYVRVPSDDGGYRNVERLTRAGRAKWERRYNEWRNAWRSVELGARDIQSLIRRYDGREPIEPELVAQVNAIAAEARNQLDR